MENKRDGEREFTKDIKAAVTLVIMGHKVVRVPPGVAGIFVQEKVVLQDPSGDMRFVADTICINLPPSLVKQGAYRIR